MAGAFWNRATIVLSEERERMRNRKSRRRRGRNRARVCFTAVVLLTLVTLTAWRLKTEGGYGQEPGFGVGRGTQMEQIRSLISGQTPDPRPEPEPEPPDPEIRDAEQERAAFLPDSVSAPLLKTTDIRDLSMEVGADASEVRFNWLSPDSAQGSVVWKNVDTGEEQSFEAQTFAATTVEEYYVNKASVTEIEPGVSYTYRVGNDAAWSPEYTYYAPKETEKLTFLVTSDVQIGQSEMEYPEQTAGRWDSVVTRLVNYVPEAQFLFHLGDQVADFGSEEQYRMFLEHLALYRIPLAPVVGNHDVANEYTIEKYGHPGGRYFYEHFHVPNRSQSEQTQYDLDGNYYFVRGETLFIVLNSNITPPYDALEEYVAEVVKEHPDVKWRILAQHYSPYSSVRKYQETNSSSIRKYLARLSIDNGIDLVLAGHEHVYARSAIVNRDCETLNDYHYQPGDSVTNPEGTLYVTCGTSSGCLYQPVEPEVRLMYQNKENVPTAIRIDITDTELHLRAYLVDSWTMCDEYTIRKE